MDGMLLFSNIYTTWNTDIQCKYSRDNLVGKVPNAISRLIKQQYIEQNLTTLVTQFMYTAQQNAE